MKGYIAKNQQPDWVIDELVSADLPLGFAENAAAGDVELVELDDSGLEGE